MADFFSTLSPGDRIVVRHRPDGENAPASDALGTFLGMAEADGARLVTVRTRRGDVSIPTRCVTHAKRVPPPPLRRTRTGSGPAVGGIQSHTDPN